MPFMIRNLHSMLRSVGASIRGPLNLETGSIGILSLIWVNPGISQNDLAENLAMKKSAIAKLVKSLEKQGCLERKRVPGDRRMNAITLTSKGHEMIASIRALSMPLNEEVVEGIPKDDLETFYRVLATLHNKLADRVSIGASWLDD
nr:MarR family winged helix-turn-helix transcriptional regulator [Maritimibacter sp. DP1N21-5]